MTLVKWDPFRELEELSSRLSRVFEREQSPDVRPDAAWVPAVDIKETPEAYILEAELPDMEKEDIKLEVIDGILTLSGERRREADTADDHVHRVERSFGTFSRSFSLPDNVDAAKIEATYEHGVLDVVLAKVATARSTAIEVRVK